MAVLLLLQNLIYIVWKRNRWQKALTVQHVDCDRLFLLDSLSVWEAGIADVVVSGVFHEHIGEI